MRKIIFLIVVLSTAILGGIMTKNRISGSNNGVSAVLGSLNGRQLYKAELSIEGMWCTSCAVGAEYNLKAVGGVIDAYVGFTDNLDGEGWVIYEKRKVSDEQIIKAIEPYKATIYSDTIYTENK